MKVKYLRTVTVPTDQAGLAGEAHDLPDRVADILIRGGYVEPVTQTSKLKGKSNVKQNDTDETGNPDG